MQTLQDVLEETSRQRVSAIHGFRHVEDYTQIYSRLPNAEGYKSLHMAILYGDYGKVYRFLHQGHNPFEWNAHLESPLTIATHSMRMGQEGWPLIRGFLVQMTHLWRNVHRIQRWWRTLQQDCLLQTICIQNTLAESLQEEIQQYLVRRPMNVSSFRGNPPPPPSPPPRTLRAFYYMENILWDSTMKDFRSNIHRDISSFQITRQIPTRRIPTRRMPKRRIRRHQTRSQTRKRRKRNVEKRSLRW